MSKYLYIIFLLALSMVLEGQNPNGNYNPYVNSGTISPSPLAPVEVNGAGEISFNIGNSGSDDLNIYDDQFITLTITLSFGDPETLNPIDAVSGTASELFSWSYNNGTYSAVQTSAIPAGYSGSVVISYKVSTNSDSPGLNGFNVNISPAPYQTESNSQNDDAVSSYTYTEIRDFGDAPVSYGSASHSLDFENYLGATVDGDISDLASVDGMGDDSNGQDDEDGVIFPADMSLGESVSIAVNITGLGRLNAWVDWNGDGDFSDSGERVADNTTRIDGPYLLNVDIPVDATINKPVFARFRFSPGSLSSAIGNASGGEVEDYMISLNSSHQAPAAPEGLKVDSSSTDYVSLSWDASPVEENVNLYRIYRQNTLIASTTETFYIDNTVQPGNNYSYTISAVNESELESPVSSEVSANTNDLTPPSVPQNLFIVSIAENSIGISWNASTDNVGVSGYHVFKNGNLLTTTELTSLTDNAVMVGNNYEYYVSAYDEAGNESDTSNHAKASINDATPPSVPQNLHNTSIDLLIVNLAWDPSTDNVGVSAYNIYRNDVLLNTVQNTTYTDDSYVTGISFSYKITASDEAGNESEASDELVVYTDDIEAPSKPENLQITALLPNAVSFSWNLSTDNVSVAGYRVIRDGAILDTVTVTEYTDETIDPESNYIYNVLAFDEAGNTSELSDDLLVSLSDISPPSKPTGLHAASVSGEGLTLKWNESIDNIKVAGYRVYKNNILHTTVNSPMFIDHSVDWGKSYSYSVSAFDPSANESEKSDPLTLSITSTGFMVVSQLAVYPNPTDGNFFIEIKEDTGRFTLEVISTQGVIVKQEILEMDAYTKPISLVRLERGFYYLRLYNNEKMYYAKVLIIN